MKSLKKVREAAAVNNKVDPRLLIGMLGECSCTLTTPDEELLFKELVDFLSRAFSGLKLSERDREICIRSFLDGEKHAVIAKDKGISRERVRQIVSKARRRLAKRLREFK